MLLVSCDVFLAADAVAAPTIHEYILFWHQLLFARICTDKPHVDAAGAESDCSVQSKCPKWFIRWGTKTKEKNIKFLDFPCKHENEHVMFTEKVTQTFVYEQQQKPFKAILIQGKKAACRQQPTALGSCARHRLGKINCILCMT